VWASGTPLIIHQITPPHSLLRLVQGLLNSKPNIFLFFFCQGCIRDWAQGPSGLLCRHSTNWVSHHQPCFLCLALQVWACIGAWLQEDFIVRLSTFSHQKSSSPNILPPSMPLPRKRLIWYIIWVPNSKAFFYMVTDFFLFNLLLHIWWQGFNSEPCTY
jgi:hypothetical protein